MAKTSAALPSPIDVRLMNAVTQLLFVSVAVALLAAVLWGVLRNPFFAIKGITVTGDTGHNTPASLSAALAQRVHGNFFTLNLDEVKRVFEAVPWVRVAVVQREFPNRLNVKLLEYVPVARWGAAGSQLVGRSGEVFRSDGSDASAGAAADLPLLLGPDGQAPLVLQVLRELDPLVKPLGTTVATLELQPRGHWRLKLANGAQIELGEGAPPDLLARFARFTETVKAVASRHERTVDDVESADLRYRNGYALRLRGVDTLNADSPKNKSNS